MPIDREARTHGTPISLMHTASLFDPALWPDKTIRDGESITVVDYGETRQAIHDQLYLIGLIRRYGNDYTLGTLFDDLTDLVITQAKRS